jgi:three-Cys-motif partner protein
MVTEFRYDEIGYWSEIKLSIIKEYASAYSTIMSSPARGPLQNRHIYIDGFAGAGVHVSKVSGNFVHGSPLNALLIEPPFSEYHLIDLDKGKAANLRKLTKGREDVFVYDEDCNPLLLTRILPRVEYKTYRRALCILDPYGLHLDWKVIEMAGKLGTVDMFLNFPVMDMNMNVLRRNPEGVEPAQAKRLTAYWGDDSWKTAAYSTDNLFALEEKQDNLAVATIFRKRLKEVAGFKNVLEPVPMRNEQGGTVYYLFFASAKATANTIVRDIFRKNESRGQRDG